MSTSVLALTTALALLVVAIWLYFGSTLTRERSGLPKGEIVYADGEAFETEPLYAHDIGLVGKPDYLLRDAQGMIVPIEIKSGKTPEQPYQSHMMQVASYCYLVEATYGIRPKYGIIQYKDTSFQVAYDQAVEALLVDVIVNMKRDLYERESERSHNNPNRCAACGVRQYCDQRLVN